MTEPLATLARRQHLDGNDMLSRSTLKRLISEVTGQGVEHVAIAADQYSLNSLSGTATLVSGTRLFFKFHSEEGEDATIREYYNAQMLRDAGYPVDVPTYASGKPGRQILLYPLRSQPRMADVCRSIELDEGGYDHAAVVAAQDSLDDRVAERMIATLHVASADEVAREGVHQLFHHRLRQGGRVSRFYAGRRHQFCDVRLSWSELCDARWVVNGVAYRHTVRELLGEAYRRLDPYRLAGAAVVAHGDAHNANVWFTGGPPETEARDLVMFDPAFAGRHVPALIAEVKATFHNVFAHPFWLYEPQLANSRFRAEAVYSRGLLEVTHDHRIGPLRTRFLDGKAQRVWRPLVAALRERELLPADWERVVRLALFCCPALVHELRAGGPAGHTPVTATIGWATAVMCGSEPVEGDDVVTRMLDGVR